MTCLDLKLIGHILRTSYFYCHAKVQFHGHWSLSYFLAFYVECHISLFEGITPWTVDTARSTFDHNVGDDILICYADKTMILDQFENRC